MPSVGPVPASVFADPAAGTATPGGNGPGACKPPRPHAPTSGTA